MFEILDFTLFNSMVFFFGNVQKPDDLGGWIDLVTHLVLCSIASVIVFRIE